MTLYLKRFDREVIVINMVKKIINISLAALALIVCIQIISLNKYNLFKNKTDISRRIQVMFTFLDLNGQSHIAIESGYSEFEVNESSVNSTVYYSSRISPNSIWEFRIDPEYRYYSDIISTVKYSVQIKFID